jgi:N6-L-threonylcarbamoyladenine synthase
MKIIIGCDTSCDDTTIGILRVSDKIEVLADIRFSQLASCTLYGGVVPEVAARNHLNKIKLCFNLAIEQASITLDQIDYFSATVGPGLIGGIIIGSNFIKTLAKIQNKPFIPIHHLEGHIAAAQEKLPFLALVISGGHTVIISCTEDKYEIICNTLDDSAGDVFDKIGRLIGLPFPAGPHIENLAVKSINYIQPLRITPGQLNFSFSGLKTNCIRLLNDGIEHADVARYLQESIANNLREKLALAIKNTNIHKLVICGGVAANKRIREVLTQDFQCFFPPISICTDNGVMVALAGLERIKKQLFINQYIDEFPYMNLGKWNEIIKNQK